MAPSRGMLKAISRISLLVFLGLLAWFISGLYSGRVAVTSHAARGSGDAFGVFTSNGSGLSLGFPSKLWQKTSSLSFSADINVDIQSWRTLNPSFDFAILDDEESDNFVRRRFHHRPEIVNLYTSLRIPIVRADLFRYLVLYSEGGVWSDLDVRCEKGVDEWVPAEYLDKANLVVGIEGVEEYRGPRVALGSQFASWVVMAKPGSEHLLYVVNSIGESLASIAQQNDIGFEDIELSMLSDVVDDSGPYKMTRGILNSLLEQTGYLLDDRDFARIKHPTLVGDVLILPGAAFAASQNGFPEDQGDTLVTHHYAGSWKAEADYARLQKVAKGGHARANPANRRRTSGSSVKKPREDRKARL